MQWYRMRRDQIITSTTASAHVSQRAMNYERNTVCSLSHRTLAVSHGHRLSITTTNECRNTSVAVRRPIYSTTRPSPINSAPLRRMLSCMCCLIINRHKTQTTSATTCSCAVSRINYCEQQFPLSAHLFEILRYSVKRLNLPSKVFTSL